MWCRHDPDRGPLGFDCRRERDHGRGRWSLLRPVSGLAGTGSKVQVISFSDTATALEDRTGDGDNSDLDDLAFVPAEDVVVPQFRTCGGYTNWDDALEMARRSPAGIAPLTVVLTDGNPTALQHLLSRGGHGEGGVTQLSSGPFSSEPGSEQGP